MSRLKDLYKSEIVDAMVKKFGYKNIMEVPKLDKIVINMGVGEAKDNSKVLETAVKELETITGQKVVTTKAKNSVANFKIREGISCFIKSFGDRFFDRTVMIMFQMENFIINLIKRRFHITVFKMFIQRIQKVLDIRN